MSLQLGLVDTLRVLDSLKSENTLVLIGGQAVNFWADHYRARCPELAQHGPFTSKDIDFQGRRDQVTACARLLNGTPYLTDPFEVGLQSGKVVFYDKGGKVEIDFMQCPAGLDARETSNASISVKVAGTVPVRVMSPFHCLKSRVHNVVELPGYNTPHAMGQLAASVICAREFKRDLAASSVRKALNQNERVFDFVVSPKTQKLYRLHGIEIFPAVACPELFPANFHAVRYPQMKQQVLEMRNRISVGPP